MNGRELQTALVAAMPRLAASRDELRDLDAAIGDGDLGITVSEGCAAVVTAIGTMSGDEPPGIVLRTIAPAIARANPSTFSALVAAGLLAASKSLADALEVDTLDLVAAGRAAVDVISTRGKSAVGDKTLLDALVPSLDAAQRAPDRALAEALDAARAGVAATRDLVSAKGRAAWIGERTRGHADPGATAYLRLLEALLPTTPTDPAAGGPSK